MVKTIVSCLVWSTALVQSTTGFAQVPAPPPPAPAVEPVAGPSWQETRVIVGTGAAAMAQGPGAGLFDFEMLSAPLGLGEHVVTNAPYSAEGVTEVVQTLADGNRIERRNIVQMARDSSGRTRREQGVAVIGSLVGGTDGAHISVFDPVARVTLMIDPSTRTVRKLRIPALDGLLGERALAARVEARVNVSGDAGRVADDIGAVGASSGQPRVLTFTRHVERGSPSRVESLGTQIVEGVPANGTRTTMTIAPGAIGNEREIEVVTERWFSPELGVLVFSRHSDPRMGETTYRLTNITRAEPPPSLFDAPAGYTVVEGPEPHRVIIRREGPR